MRLYSFAANLWIEMDTRIIKIAIALASLAFTVFLFIDGSWGKGIVMLFPTAFLIFMLFRSVRLIMVFWRMRQQKMDKAKLWLDRVNPDKLWKKQEAYYYFMLGSVELNSNKITKSEKYFKRAISTGLRMDHDKAAAKLNLAMIAMAKQKKREAMTLIAEAKKIDKKGMLKKDIKEVEKMIKKPQKVIRQRR